MTKFDYNTFYGYYPDREAFGCNKEKYSKEDAIKLARQELDAADDEELFTTTGYVYRGYGVDDNGEKRNSWWLITDPDHASDYVNYIEVWTVYRRGKWQI